jgi:hypothetical protein
MQIFENLIGKAFRDNISIQKCNLDHAQGHSFHGRHKPLKLPSPLAKKNLLSNQHYTEDMRWKFSTRWLSVVVSLMAAGVKKS